MHETRVVKDRNGNKRMQIKTSCPCCDWCWMYVDNGICSYGGPFSGYAQANSNDPAPEWPGFPNKPKG